MEAPFEGPYEIKKVNDNETVRMQVGNITDTYNIRRLKPYQE